MLEKLTSYLRKAFTDPMQSIMDRQTFSRFFGWADVFRSRRLPLPAQMVERYAGFIYTCSNINAVRTSCTQMRLFVKRNQRDPKTRFATRPLQKSQRRWLEQSGVTKGLNSGMSVEEVIEHPVLDLLDAANSRQNGFELEELTHLYKDVTGKAYWIVGKNPLGIPQSLWLAGPHVLRQIFTPDGHLDRYEYTASGHVIEKFAPEDVIAFRMPDLRDPYFGGVSPAAALFEESEYAFMDLALQNTLLKNQGRPEYILSPKTGEGAYIGEEEADRWRIRFRQEFSRAKAGGVLVAPGPIDLKPLTKSSQDMEGMLRRKASLDEIANGFGIPLALVTANTNLANLNASLKQHGLIAVTPRKRMYCQVLTAELIPLYDQSGRFFFGYDNPCPEDEKLIAERQEVEIRSGKRTINEVRGEDGDPPVPWGERPWLNSSLSQPSDDASLNERSPKPVPVVAPPALPGKEPVVPPEPKSMLDRELRFQKTMKILSDLVLRHVGRKLAVARLVKQIGLSVPQAFDCSDLVLELLPEDDAHSESCPSWTHPEWCKGHRTAKGGHHRALPNGEKIEEACKDIFKKQLAYCLEHVTKCGFGLVKAPHGEQWNPISLRGFNEETQRRMHPALEFYYKEGIEETVARIGAGAEMTVTNPNIRLAIDQATMDVSKVMNETTEKRLNDKISELKSRLAEGILEEENTPKHLTEIVMSVFENASESRARAIALTESSRAVHTAQRMTAVQSGIVKGFFLILSDDACDLCQEVAETHPEGVGLNDSFGSAAGYDNGPDDANTDYDELWSPPFHTNCRCTIGETIDYAAVNAE